MPRSRRLRSPSLLGVLLVLLLAGTAFGATGTAPILTNSPAQPVQVDFTSPVARYSIYPQVDPDGDGIIHSLPIPEPGSLRYLPGDLSHATDSDVSAAMSAEAVPVGRVSMTLNLTLGVSEYDTVRQAALDALNGSAYHQLASVVAGTPAAVGFWCGSNSSVTYYQWVLEVPLPVDCVGNGAFVYASAGLVCDTTDLLQDGINPCIQPGGFFGDQIPRPADRVNLSFSSRVASTFSGNAIVGFQYEQQSFAAYGPTSRSWSLLTHLSGLSGSLVTGDASLAATPGFSRGDVVYVSDGSNLLTSTSFNLTMNNTAASNKVAFREQVDNGVMTQMAFLPVNPTAYNAFQGYVNLGQSESLQVRAGGDRAGFSLWNSNASLSDGGWRHQFWIKNITDIGTDFSATGGSVGAWNFSDELNLTYTVGGVPQVGVVTAGLPPIVVFQPDVGAGSTGIASVEVAAQRHVTDGTFRTVTVNTYATPIRLDATASYTQRVELVTGPHDVYHVGPLGPPFVMAAVHATDPSQSSLLTKGYQNGQLTYQTSITGSTSTADTYSMSLPSCITGCSGQLLVGNAVNVTTATFVGGLWAVRGSNTGSLDQVPIAVCIWHRGDGTCD